MVHTYGDVLGDDGITSWYTLICFNEVYFENRMNGNIPAL